MLYYPKFLHLSKRFGPGDLVLPSFGYICPNEDKHLIILAYFIYTGNSSNSPIRLQIALDKTHRCIDNFDIYGKTDVTPLDLSEDQIKLFETTCMLAGDIGVQTLLDDINENFIKGLERNGSV